MSKIGFVGVGAMGGPMARNVARGGHEVHAYDLYSGAVQQLADVGIKPAASAAEAARDAAVVITMLSNSAHVEEAVFGRDGLISTLPPGRCTST